MKRTSTASLAWTRFPAWAALFGTLLVAAAPVPAEIRTMVFEDPQGDAIIDARVAVDDYLPGHKIPQKSGFGVQPGLYVRPKLATRAA